MSDGYRVLVCGGRDFATARMDERDLIYFTLSHMHEQSPISVLIHGAADGADTEAAIWARTAGVREEAYKADWRDLDAPGAIVRVNARGQKFNAMAGPARNARMLKEGKPDVVIAFPGNDGTANMIEQANGAGVKVVEVDNDLASMGGDRRPLYASMWTAELLARRDARLWAQCPACGLSKSVDLDGLVQGGYGARRVETMKLKCSECGGNGSAKVVWLGAGKRQAFRDFATGEQVGR